MNYWKASTMVLAGALTFVMATGGGATEAQAEKQPRMRAALYNLKQAKNNLEKAAHDKGGHRVKALAATKTAINQVEKGITHDNQR